MAPIAAPEPAPIQETPAKEKPQRVKKPKIKCDPAHLKKARELRDRWLEQVNAGQFVLASAGKYEVGLLVDEKRERKAVCLPSPTEAQAA